MPGRDERYSMFSPMFTMLLIPFLVAMFLSINMGGSGAAAAFSAPYGAKLIRKDLIPGLFGLCVFAGAILAGRKVTETIGKGIMPQELMGQTLVTIILLSVSLSLLFANLLRIPQCTSQATVLSLMGPALYMDVLMTDKLRYIVPVWIALPLASFVITFVIAKILRTWMERREYASFRGIVEHPVLKGVVILASCFVAFAIGANNVANAAGPIASMVFKELSIPAGSENQLLVVLLATLIIAPCFGIGGSIFGARVIKTTGRRITNIGPMGAALVSVVTASLLVLASVTKGIPASVVQLNAGAVIGLGMAKSGLKEMGTNTSVRKLLAVWIIAPLIAFGLSFGLTALADALGWL